MMTTERFLSRVRLNKNASVAALLPLLLANNEASGQSQHSGHHLVWSLFTDGPDRRRDFLWREMEQRGTFLILSSRPPVDHHELFEIDEPKLFAPLLEAGDQLQFSLRANPVVRRRDSSRTRSVKHDVVMDALRTHSKGDRAEYRFTAIQEQGLAWLKRQGDNTGFTIRPGKVSIDSYQQHRISRKGPAAAMTFATMDFNGILDVRDPVKLLSGLAQGFGAAKAYGCGLMLIRRT